MSDELDIESAIIDEVLEIIQSMKESNKFHNPTLEELEQRLK
jgi:hypothetical protein